MALLVASVLIAEPSLARQARGREHTSPRATNEYVLHPFALAELIEELGGRRVTLVRTRVAAVLNARVFLIESAGWPPSPPHYNRVAVFVEAGRLSDPELVIDENVRVIGVARTLLGMQTTREVPWPPELTREVLKRYDIRAAVLANSVQTADGVELTSK